MAPRRAALPRRPTARLSKAEKLALLNEIAAGDERFLADYSGLLESFLDDPAAEVRLGAIHLLWEYPEPRFVKSLIAAASDPSPDVRLAAIEALGRHLYEGETSDEPPGEGRWAAIRAPRRTAGHEAAGFLRTLYHHSERTLEERRRALEALGFTRSPDIQALIAEAYHSGDPQWQLSSVVAMGRSGDPAWEPALLRELESANMNIRVEAARAAGASRVTAAVPTLVRYARRGNIPRRLRLWSIFALGQIGAQSALPLLERLTVASDPEVAATAQAALDEWFYANSDDDFDQEQV